MKLVSADAKKLWQERIDLLHKRMTSTSKEEWDKLNDKSLEIEAEQKKTKGGVINVDSNAWRY